MHPLLTRSGDLSNWASCALPGFKAEDKLHVFLDQFDFCNYLINLLMRRIAIGARSDF
jgi:hypothetical protein